MIIRHFVNFFPHLTILPNIWTNMLTTERKQYVKTCQIDWRSCQIFFTANCTLTHPHLCHLDNLGHRHKPRPEISLLLIVNPNIKARYSVISNIMNYEIFSAHLMNAIVLVPATELIARANLHKRWLSHKVHHIGQLSKYSYELCIWFVQQTLLTMYLICTANPLNYVFEN